MDNLNEEIDLVLAESLLLLEEEGEGDDAAAADAEAERAEAERAEAARVEAKRRAKLAKKEEATKILNRASTDDDVKKIATALRGTAKLFGVRATSDSDNLIINLVAAALENPTYDSISSWQPALPKEEDVAAIVWYARKWKALPAPVKVLIAKIPQLRPLAMAAEASADELDSIGTRILGELDEDPSSIEAPGVLRWLGLENAEIANTLIPLTGELTDEQAGQTMFYMKEAAKILAAKAYNTGRPSQFIAPYGKIIRKYFISKRVAREGIGETYDILEEIESTSKLLEADEERSAPSTGDSTEPEAASVAARFASDGAIEELISSLTETVKVKPEEAKETLEKIKRAYSGELDKKTGTKDVLNKKGIAFLILRAAGTDADSVKDVLSLRESKELPFVLDLNKLKSNRLDEGMLRVFGAWIEYYLKGLFGLWGSNLSVKGSKSDLESFSRALNGEARYMNAIKKYGLDHPTTIKNKAKLGNAVKGFERETGIKWPFK